MLTLKLGLGDARPQQELKRSRNDQDVLGTYTQSGYLDEKMSVNIPKLKLPNSPISSILRH